MGRHTLMENMENIHLFNDDCLKILSELKENSIDSVVTDPPYGLEFFGGTGWNAGQLSDTQSLKDNNVFKSKGFGKMPIYRGMTNSQKIELKKFHFSWAKECFRVMKPGAFLLSFSSEKTYHLLADQIEEAGFEIRNMLAWVYASGFPKHKTNLKPAFEPIVLARKPVVGTVIKNVDTYRTGQLNIEDSKFEDRWPTTLIHDGFDDLSPYFYCPKINAKDKGKDNNHPTVKPTKLMTYLCKLVTPTKGTILDPFLGSGSTGKAAVINDFKFIGIEIDEKYFKIAKQRIYDNQYGLFV